MDNKKAFEALEAAIKFEEDGRTFFLAASEKTEEKFSKSLSEVWPMRSWTILKGSNRSTIP